MAQQQEIILHEAATMEEELFKLTLQKKPDELNSQDLSGHTPLYKACKFDKVENVKILLNAKADPSMRGVGSFSPLWSLFRWGLTPEKLEIMKILLDKGADCEKDRFGNTLSHMVAQCGDQDALKILLEHGIDVNAVNQVGDTALHVFFTKYYGTDFLKVILTLIEYGADLDIKNNEGKTPEQVIKHDEVREAYKEAIKLNQARLEEQKQKEQEKTIQPEHVMLDESTSLPDETDIPELLGD